jgi:hypothetical protein
MAWCKMNANQLLAMCMKETTMSETLNGKLGRWVRANRELRKGVGRRQLGADEKLGGVYCALYDTGRQPDVGGMGYL